METKRQIHRQFEYLDGKHICRFKLWQEACMLNPLPMILHLTHSVAKAEQAIVVRRLAKWRCG